MPMSDFGTHREGKSGFGARQLRGEGGSGARWCVRASTLDARYKDKISLHDARASHTVCSIRVRQVRRKPLQTARGDLRGG
jgi:hypothetical protein